ncbi:hypothetical protein H310_09670 [Aphanomyces invadans]|uniref:Uncharacterized protein n=1 Tax=Aphanomyces invadans TaxID=157072 RepID=A0A024TT65_9STRA|nr:hypothetical protein H310_09670 [Aphanomyces invadans]ETV97330.1 hypothetical protein H310_09670 [Aphanomyces invadans]|eukprot:XP_008874038.1 hypothetical protein H310_09670 [Aphanomyces invadans]
MRLTDINQQQNSHSTTRSCGGPTPIGLSSSSSAANPAASPSLRWPPPLGLLLTPLDDSLQHPSSAAAPLCRPHHIFLAANLTSNTHQQSTRAPPQCTHTSSPSVFDASAGGLGAVENLPRKVTTGSSPSGKPPVDNPFDAWFRTNKPTRNPRAAPRRSVSAVTSSAFPAFGDFPPPPPSAFTSSCPSMTSIGGDSTDNEDDMDEHSPSAQLNTSPSYDLKRQKAVEDAQRHFRCMDVACMLDMDDADVMPPPVLVRAQAQMLLHHEEVALTCRRCGAIEHLAISY